MFLDSQLFSLTYWSSDGCFSCSHTCGDGFQYSDLHLGLCCADSTHKESCYTEKRNSEPKTMIRTMISIGGVLFLFGLTWLFFILTFSVHGLRETFQILFTVFNSLQGAFIFSFILFTEGFNYWKVACSSKIQKLSGHLTSFGMSTLSRPGN